MNRILLVDDETNILKAVKRLTFGKGIELTTCSDPQSALELLEKEPYPLVISDYRMPGMNGAQFLKAVEEKQPRTLRVILSGYIDKETVLNTLFDGTASAFIPKPWDEEAIVSAMQQGLQIARQGQCCGTTAGILGNHRRLFSPPVLATIAAEAAAIEGEPLADLTWGDPFLVLKTVMIANSEFYNPGRIASMKSAIQALGSSDFLRQTSRLADMAQPAPAGNAAALAASMTAVCQAASRESGLSDLSFDIPTVVALASVPFCLLEAGYAQGGSDSLGEVREMLTMLAAFWRFPPAFRDIWRGNGADPQLAGLTTLVEDHQRNGRNPASTQMAEDFLRVCGGGT